jgi:hypothetical protein
MVTTQQRIRAVTNYTLEYVQQWQQRASGAFEIPAAQLLLASGRGSARPLSCEQTLRHIRWITTAKGDALVASQALLLRALALLRPGELRALCVADPTILAFILSALAQQQQERDEGAHSAPVLASLCSIDCRTSINRPEVAFGFLERYAANITALRCPLQRRCGAADNVLARCTRLESLMCAYHYAPSAWLQLSQLHTLRGVDLSVVSMAAIAAALPPPAYSRRGLAHSGSADSGRIRFF